MKIITVLIFMCALIIYPHQFAMEGTTQWDSFIFIPSVWTVTTFFELQGRNEGNLEREKDAFITLYKNKFRKLYWDNDQFLRCTAQQLMRMGCENRLAQNPHRALKG